MARVCHAVALARGVEALLLGVGAGLALQGLAVHTSSSTAPGSLPAWCAALVGGCAVAATWWIETRPRPERIARQVDRGLGLQGELVTAFECEGRPPPSILVELLLARVVQRVKTRSAVHAALPASMPFLAFPFLGAGLLAFALDSRPGAALTPDWLARAAGDLAAQVQQAEDLAFEALRAGSGADGLDLERLTALAQAARELARDTATGPAAGPSAPGEGPGEGPGERLAALRRELEALLSSAERGPDRAALERALDRADGALLALDRGPDAAAGLGADPGHPRGQDPSGAIPSTASGDGVGSALAQGAPDGRITGSHDPTRTAADALTSAAGVAGTRWWPQRHAGLVARWIEARRATDQPQDSD